MNFAVDLAQDHLRTRHRQFIALAAHVLDENAQMQQAATGHAELVRVGRGFHAQRDVGLEFALQAVTDLATGDELAFLAGERGLVDLEGHAHRRFVDLQGRQGIG